MITADVLVRLAAALLLVAPAVSVVAAPDDGLAERVLSQPVRPPPDNCESADRSGLELCAVARFRAADAELNRVYRALLAREGADEKNRGLLRDAQRAWLSYRDKTCAWESDAARGGSAATLYAVNCLGEVTAARASYLDANGP